MSLTSRTKKINRRNFQKLEFPYYSDTISRKKLLAHFKKLKKYKPTLVKDKSVTNKIKKFKDSYIVWEEDYEKNNELYKITDYFSEECRVRCKYQDRRSKNSLLNSFKKNKNIIFRKLSKKNKISYYQIKEYLWENFKQCTNFNTTIAVCVVRLLKSKRWLDFSAGWGDRLVGAIACNCFYVGVDPNPCLHPKYRNIVKTLASSKNRKNYQLYQSPFETAEIKERDFDLVFTSPPFFELENYTEHQNQSHHKFKTLDAWFQDFLVVSVRKSCDLLVVGGYLALYISDYTKTKFVARLKKYIEENMLEMKYQGDLHWKYANAKPRTIFVWQKMKM